MKIFIDPAPPPVLPLLSQSQDQYCTETELKC